MSAHPRESLFSIRPHCADRREPVHIGHTPLMSRPPLLRSDRCYGSSYDVLVVPRMWSFVCCLQRPAASL